MAKSNKNSRASQKADHKNASAHGASQTSAISPVANSANNTSKISRYISLGLLIAVILIFLFLCYGVLAKFLVPLFLAALLVVVFRPLHQWILACCGNRAKVGALLTTAAIMLVVLIPCCLLLMLAAGEGRSAFRRFNTVQIYDGIKKVRTSLNLDLPQPIQIIDAELTQAQELIGLGAAKKSQHQRLLSDVNQAAQELAAENSLPWNELPSPSETDLDSDADLGPDPATNWEKFANSLRAANAKYKEIDWKESDSATEKAAQESDLLSYQLMLNNAEKEFSNFRPQLLGGKTKSTIIELANPSSADLKSYIQEGTTFLTENLVGISRTGASWLGNMLLGTAIMTIGLYFFLLDGPRMLQSFKGLSPIDDDHEEELAMEFARVSRAVVVATLLSALVQGLLAGIGFYFADLNSIFLLTVLSAVLAMVPFVGAAAVWVPCCLYLFFIDNNMPAAIGLAIYGVAVISMADNVIKPYVLHGQSNLHPLLALLSVLGGVASLGPIGILVGPMVVAFLQTLLKILQREMQDLDQSTDLAIEGINQPVSSMDSSDTESPT